ncbi:amino acid transporter [Annulohypoxylon stygium]|nr:amino acid transporter [Annulohypoxylon stygium]
MATMDLNLIPKEGEQPNALVQSSNGPSSRDDFQLARLGKRPVLKRNFGFMAILGFSCTVLITWEGSLIGFISGLQNGGPSGIIYSFLVVWVGMLSVFSTLSELVSMAPTSGGQYHWVSILAPPSSRKFFGYITGWLEITGWQSLVASGGYVTGTMIQGIILLTHPEYADNMQNWHGTLLFWGVVLLSYAINTAVGSLLAKFESLFLVIHLLGFFAVIFPLAFLSEHSDSASVFNTFLNPGGWQTQGLAFCIGLLGNVFAFLGGDAAIHMSEEIRNAAVVVPRSLLTSLLVNGTLGFGMLIATLYCMGDIDEALAQNPHYPFMSIFKNATGSTAGAAVMSSIVVVMAFSATTGCLASTSRVYFAFARDRGLPGWRTLKKVSPRTSIPIYSVITTTIIAIILSLVNIGDATAFNGVISISTAGLFGSYLVAASLLLYRRITGGIGNPNDNDVLTNTVGTSLTWGPWRLRGIFGIANNAFTCIFLVFIFFFSFWPPALKVTPQTMNWAVLVFGAVILFSMLYYAVWARKVYSGPIIESIPYAGSPSPPVETGR